MLSSALPAHFLDQFDAGHEIACATGPKEEAVMFYEKTGHCYGFGISDPTGGEYLSFDRQEGDTAYLKASSTIGRASSKLWVRRLMPLAFPRW